MHRYATIDVGTNSVLLLVAERESGGSFRPVAERAEITRLGRGVDRTRRLSPEAMEETLRVVQSFAEEARRLGAREIAAIATSAARDAQNGAELLAAARARAGLELEIISGEREAQLSYLSAFTDFGGAGHPLVVIDIGGGSTELIQGGGGERAQEVAFRKSFEVGSVRLTERLVQGDPLSRQDRQRIEECLMTTFEELPPPLPGWQAVGVAGTVTTLYAVRHQIQPYDAARVHGQRLSLEEVREVAQLLCDTPLARRRALAGLQPKRADVIPAGALILKAVLERLGAAECLVSDRGLRWGLLLHRFGEK